MDDIIQHWLSLASEECLHDIVEDFEIASEEWKSLLADLEYEKDLVKLLQDIAHQQIIYRNSSDELV